MAESGEIVWSLGCDVTIEDFDSSIEEIKVGDISLSGVVSVGELPVDVDSDRVNVMDLDVSFSVDGVHSTIIESQVVPHARIVEIESYSPEATNEKRYAASAYAAKKILDSLTETNNKVSKNENAIGNLQTAVNELEKKVDENEGGTGESHWYLGNDGKIHTDNDIVVHGNAIIEGDTSSGGAGEDITVGLDEQAVLDLLEREKYVTEDDIAGLVPEVDLSDYYKATQVDDLLKKYYTNTEVDGFLLKKANTQDVYTKEELNPYKAWWDKVMAHLTVDENGNVTIDTNLIVSGDTASGGEGEDITVGLDEQAVLDLLEEKGYVTENDIAGLIPDDYVNSAELTEIVNEINAKIAKKADSSALQNLQNEVDNIEAVLGMDEEAEGIINTWNEVKAFLDGYSSSDDLATILSNMNADIAKRALQSDLESLGLIVDGLGNNKADKASVYTKDEIDSSVSAIYGNITNLTNNKADKTSVYTKTEIDSKVSTINDAINGIDGRVDVVEAWKDLLGKYIVIEGTNVRIKTNLVIDGDAASGGSGEDIVVGIQGIKVNNTKYNDSGDGYVDLTDAFNSIDVSGELANYYTKDEVDGKIANFATTDALTSGLFGKVDKVSGKALSTNDFTDALLTKLNGIAEGAEVNVQSDWNATSGDAFIKNKPTIPTNTNQLDNGAGYITSAALNGYATQSWVNEQGFAKASAIPTLKSLMGATAIGGTSSYIYWNGSAWATKALGDRAFDSTAYQPLSSAINTGNIANQLVKGLAKAVSIWGQSFDGTKDINGALYLGNESSLYFKNASGDTVSGLHVSVGNNMWMGYNNGTSIKACIAGSEVRLYYGGVSNIGLLLNSSGNVGIGTTSPAYKLDVNGVTKASAFIAGNVCIVCDSNGNTSGYSGEINRLGGGQLWIQSREGGLQLGNAASITNFNGEVTMQRNLIVAGDVASGGAGQETTGYLPLSGGTIGSASGGSFPLDIISANAYTGISFYTSGGRAYFRYQGGSTWGVTDNGWNNSYTLIHSGNIGGYAFEPKTQIISNTDADTLLTNGVYLNATGNGSGNSHFPSTYSTFLTFSQSSKYAAQISIGNNAIHMRRKIDSWGHWMRIIAENENGNVGIGTTSPSQKLHVAGNIYATGSVTQGSDIRFKHRMNDVNLDLDVMANAPLFNFYWNDRNDNQIHIGTSAQYWEIYRNELVSGTDFKGLDYSTLGVAMGISIARKTLDHESRIKVLEDKIKEVA